MTLITGLRLVKLILDIRRSEYESDGVFFQVMKLLSLLAARVLLLLRCSLWGLLVVLDQTGAPVLLLEVLIPDRESELWLVCGKEGKMEPS